MAHELCSSARALGAGLIITGSLEDVGQTILLSLQGIDVRDCVMTGAASRSFSRPEELPDHARRLAAEVMRTAFTANPLPLLSSDAVARAATALAQQVRRELSHPVHGRVVGVLPTGTHVLVRLDESALALDGHVLHQGAPVGEVVKQEGREVIVRTSQPLGDTVILDFPVSAPTLHWVHEGAVDAEPVARIHRALDVWIARQTSPPGVGEVDVRLRIELGGDGPALTADVALPGDVRGAHYREVLVPIKTF